MGEKSVRSSIEWDLEDGKIDIVVCTVIAMSWTNKSESQCLEITQLTTT
jgi:hypothetical protein